MANDSMGNVSPHNESYFGDGSGDVVEDVIQPIFYSLVVLTGVIGNSLVVLIVKRTPHMQTTTNLLLANLAVADLLALVGSIPNEVLLQISHPTGTLGRCLCALVSTGNATVMCLFVSILVLTVLAVERYNGLVKPFDSRRALTKRKVTIVVVGIWLVSLVCTIPLYLSTIYDPMAQWCDSIWDHSAIVGYITFVLVGFLLFPFSIISFSYISVIRELYFKQEAQPEASLQSIRESDIRSKKRIVKLLLLVTVVFGVSFGTFGLCRFLYENDRIDNILYNISVLLLYSSCSANPLIYAFQSPNYRKAFTNILGVNTAEPRTIGRSRVSTRPTPEVIEI